MSPTSPPGGSGPPAADWEQRDPRLEETSSSSSDTRGSPATKEQELQEKLPVELQEVVWIEFEAGDPANPYNWPTRQKWTTCVISTLFTLTTAIAGAAFSLGNASMVAELNCSQDLANLAFAAFPLGFGLAPLVLAPFSEAYGRYPMYVSSSMVFGLFWLPMALGQNIATVIIARLISGLAGSTGATLVGGTVADLFVASDRGTPMSLFSFCAFAGTGLGPAVAGYVEEYLGWRWISWIQLIIAGIMFLAITLCTKETRGSVILSRRAARMRKDTGDPRYQCKSDAERASLAVLVKVSMTRPLLLLFTEPIVAAFSLWVGFSWAVLYTSIKSVPLVFQRDYGFSIGQVGLVFFAIVVSAFVGYLGNIYQEKLYKKHQPKRGPEARLYTAMHGGLMFPAGLLIFAFTPGRGHWSGPVIGLFVTFYGIFTIYLCTFNYLADSYTVYASSALSGQSLCRNLAGFAWPMFTLQMFTQLGYQWASFLSACLALALSVIPFVLFAYGPQIRARSRFAKALAAREAGE